MAAGGCSQSRFYTLTCEERRQLMARKSIGGDSQKQNKDRASDAACEYTFTVFTPTYNRAHTLPRVYDSLRAQTFRDFEWLIVDDASSDNTQELVARWREQALFPIRYLSQEKSGKHFAFNLAVRAARGKLFLNLDSDDACTPEALERLLYHWSGIPKEEREMFAGVTVLCKDQNGLAVGDRFPLDVTDSDALEIRFRYNVSGEKWNCYRIDVLREFPFPEVLRNHSHLPEGLVWDAIARSYKTRHVNEFLRIYWIEGPSICIGGDPGKNAASGRLYTLKVLNNDLDWLPWAPLTFFRTAASYARYSLHLHVSFWEQITGLETLPAKMLWMIGFPIGCVCYLRDRIKTGISK
jgi:glycosyltransferase involved in cell wall biosynthesis